MKVVMFGPCYGHNIEPFIEFFHKRKDHKLSFVFTGDDFFFKNKKYPLINFLRLNFNPPFVFKTILAIKDSPDLIWFHANNVYVLLFFLFFRNKKDLFVINIWSEKIPRLILSNSIKGRLWKYALSKGDYIQCNWYGTEELLKKSMEDSNIVVHPWGLHEDYFKTEYNNIGDIALNFVEKLPKDKVKFYYPKSITFSSDHDAIIDAVADLVKKSTTNFVVYFWMGNILDKKQEKVLVEKIRQLELSDFIKMEKHNYISYNDIKYIWSHMDVGLQIAIFDQLSSTLLEPMLMQKEVIATDIEPYRKLNELYSNINLKLISRNSGELSKAMKYYVEGGGSSQSLILARKIMVEDEFNFSNNLEKTLFFYQNSKMKSS
jgi:hypothetical protein